MIIKKYKCGLCESGRNDKYVGTRKSLRKHLREEHRILRNLANASAVTTRKLMRQSWWITEEFE